jgi:hypothetical protein
MSKKSQFFRLLFLLQLFSTALLASDADSISYRYRLIKTDRERIEYLSNTINAVLTDHARLGDSLAGVMLEVAEFSRNRELNCLAYSYLARQYINYKNYRSNLATGEQYADRCLQLAKRSGLDQYTITAYLLMARANRAKSNNQKALEYNNLALSLAVNYGNDSITSVCYSGLSNTWMAMNNKLSSFQSRLSARDFAEKSKSVDRITSTTKELANFYASINENEKAKDLFYSVMDMSRRSADWESLMVAQRALGDIYTITGQKQIGFNFYNQAMKIADSVGRSGYKINVYFDLLNYFFNYETAENGLAYFESQPEITRFLKASGQAYNIDKIKGFYFCEKKNYDSADYYFDTVLRTTEGSVNRDQNFNFYNFLAGMYGKRGVKEKQSFYLMRCAAIADSTGDIEMKKSISLALDSFYLAAGKFKEAHYHYGKYNLYNDSLRTLSEQKDLLGLEIDNENKRKVKQEETALLDKQKRNNIQYLGITAAIATVFILLVLSGVFKISIPVIKALGFFAFIFLFEFIILLADNQIHEWTHGEPWKVMVFKIILIAMLLPLHHWLEHRVIQYLLTHNMLPKKVFSLAALRKNKPVLPDGRL